MSTATSARPARGSSPDWHGMGVPCLPWKRQGTFHGFFSSRRRQWADGLTGYRGVRFLVEPCGLAGCESCGIRLVMHKVQNW